MAVPGKSTGSLTEDRIVGLLQDRFTVRSPLIVKGVGDDAAVLRQKAAEELWVVTTDMLLEDVDFRREWQSPVQLGWKSLAVNLSDLAAMGARPRFYTVSLALPRGLCETWIAAFYRGLKSLGDSHNAALVGGDLSRSAGGIQISITAIGETRRRRVVYRSGGRPGDLIFVTGVLGQSAAGLCLLQQGRNRGRTGAERRALESHRRPHPRSAAGQWLAQSGFARAMMDISDGLSMDLPRLCRASRTGASICASQIPCFVESEGWGCNPIELALHGGEDFELLFCVSPRKASLLTRAWPPEFPPLSNIGRLERGGNVIWKPGPGSSYSPLPRRGFDHFSPKPRA